MSDRDAGLQEWEAGLPAPEELMPLSQTLIPPDLALAFNINFHARADVPKFSNAADDAIVVARRLQPQASQTASRSHACLPNPMQHSPMIPMLPEANALTPIKCLDHVVPCKTLNLWGSLGADQQHKVTNLDRGNGQTADILGLNTREANDLPPGDDSSEGGSSKQLRKRVETDLEDVDSNFVGTEISNEDSTAVPRTLKRPRLVWTPQLHKRFVEAVAQLGIKHAVPKTIMQLMNVDGLTRENVASHLQKYRLYLKRMQGLSSECLSMQDHLFASPSLSLGLSGSPQFVPNHREDIMPFLMPVTAGSLGAGQIAEKLPFSLPNTEFTFNNGFPQPFTCQRMSQTHPFDGHTQQGSPQGQALKLFPATGT